MFQCFNIIWKLVPNFDTLGIYRHFWFFYFTIWCYEFNVIPCRIIIIISECFIKTLAFKFKHFNICLEIWNSYSSVCFNFLGFSKYSVMWVLQGRLWMALHAFFFEMNILQAMSAYVPCQTVFVMFVMFLLFLVANIYTIWIIAHIFRYFSSYHVFMIFEWDVYEKLFPKN